MTNEQHVDILARQSGFGGKMTRPLYLIALGLVAASPALAGDTEITPYGLVNLWGTLYDQDEEPTADPSGYGDPNDALGVKIRRARLGTYGRHRWLDWGVAVGMGAPVDTWFVRDAGVGLIDAYAGASIPAGPGALRFSLGAQKVPVSREVLMSVQELTFQERTVQATHLAPFRDAGLVVDYAMDNGLRFRAGAFNGNNDLLGDDNLGILATGRVEFAQGDAYATFKPTREDAWGLAASALYDDDLSSRTVRFSGDALVRVGPFSAMAEGTWLQIAPTDTTLTNPQIPVVTNRWGGFVQLGAYQPLPVGGLEFAVRGEVFDDSVKLRDNGDLSLIYGGVTWRDPMPGFDIGLGYVHRAELAGRTIDNDTLRMWVQVVYPARDRALGGLAGWTDRFVGTWQSAEADGALALSGTDDQITGELHLADGTTAPVTESFYDPTHRLLTIGFGPEDARLWLELQPQRGGTLCGWQYDDGERDAVIRSGPDGAYACWRRGRRVQKSSELAAQ